MAGWRGRSPVVHMEALAKAGSGEEAGEETQLNTVGPPHSFPQLSLDRCETTTRTLASQALHPQHSLSWSLCLQQESVLLPDLMQVPREPTT